MGIWLVAAVLLAVGAVVATWPWSGVGLVVLAVPLGVYAYRHRDAIATAARGRRPAARTAYRCGARLRPDEFHRVRARLGGAAGEAPCPMCGSRDRHLVEDLFRLDRAEARTLDGFEQTIPVVVLACAGCGRLDLVAARRLLG